jgi:hypothetical protein
MKSTSAANVLFAACLLSCMCGGAFAQTNAASSGTNQPPAGAQAGQQPSDAPPEAPNEEDRQTPVLQVTSVEVMRSTHGPALDVIRARGLTSTDGWEEGELVPLTSTPSSDGILDLIFVARAPADAMEATGFAEIEAIFPLEPGHPYKGVRVTGASGPVTLKTLPGYAEAAFVQEDCNKCIGKIFVPKGGTPPAGQDEASIVKEEHLPKTLRIMKLSDGIAKQDSDPNRLTLVIDDDGKIVTAVWD